MIRENDKQKQVFGENVISNGPGRFTHIINFSLNDNVLSTKGYSILSDT